MESMTVHDRKGQVGANVGGDSFVGAWGGVGEDGGLGIDAGGAGVGEDEVDGEGVGSGVGSVVGA